MKRVAVLSLFCFVLVAAGCQTYPPASSYESPTIVSTDVSTTEVVAGSTFTVTAVATDDHAVTRAAAFVFDSTQRFRFNVPCEVAEFEPGPIVTVEATCTMPAVAPNGQVILRVEAYDAGFLGLHPQGCECGSSQTALTVTGGTEDREPPVISELVFSPQPVTVGTPFTVTFSASDEHPGSWSDSVNLSYVPNSSDTSPYCTQTSHTVLSPTEHEWVFTCPAPVHAELPLLTGILRDEIGHFTRIWERFEVVAP